MINKGHQMCPNLKIVNESCLFQLADPWLNSFVNMQSCFCDFRGHFVYFDWLTYG